MNQDNTTPAPDLTSAETNGDTTSVSEELSITFLGKTFTESEYRVARRHNTIRWLVSMLIGIPVFCLLILTFGFLWGFAGSVFILPLVYEGATRIFPGSRKYGTPLYKKFVQTRELALYRAKSAS